MPDSHIEIQDHTEEWLKGLEGAYEKALTAIGLVAEGYAKENCPVDTGRLRNSITNAVDLRETAAYIGTNVDYAPFVELGTHTHKAHPYLKPAATKHSDEYKNIIQDALQNG